MGWRFKKMMMCSRIGGFLALFMLAGWPAFNASGGVILSNLYSFQVSTIGSTPYGTLLKGGNGEFYGTTYYGGISNQGTLFKISTNGALTRLYSFTGGDDGANPRAGLAEDGSGNFYGTTSSGTNNYGAVFEFTAGGSLVSLHSFTLGSDGGSPYGGLVAGGDGYFYGMTQGGGIGYGTVFKIDSSGTLVTLYSFTGGNDGNGPDDGLVKGSDGNFYGTTVLGGTNNSGTIFKISAGGTLHTLYSFTGTSDGSEPAAALVQGSDGNFYGTTFSGGADTNGTVFKISANGAFKSLFSFTGNGAFYGGIYGANPYAGLVQGSDGNFYGTTTSGGTYNFGNVFKITTNGVLTSLYSFTDGNDGGFPYGGLVQNSDGSFYGTTGFGASYGNVFRMTITPTELSIALARPNVILSWPANAAGFTLESTMSLLPPINWRTNSTNTFVVAGWNVVTNPISGAGQFYRLVQ